MKRCRQNVCGLLLLENINIGSFKEQKKWKEFRAKKVAKERNGMERIKNGIERNNAEWNSMKQNVVKKIVQASILKERT